MVPDASVVPIVPNLHQKSAERKADKSIRERELLHGREEILILQARPGRRLLYFNLHSHPRVDTALKQVFTLR